MNDGGPAFPEIKQARDQHGRPKLTNCGGMSLRDWFAGQALASMAHPQNIGEPKISAKMAYEVADAMLAEREKDQT